MALGLGAAVACSSCDSTWPDADRERPVTGGEPGNSRYSELDQLNRRNVHRLRVAWVYHTRDASADNRSEIQATPIVVRGVLQSTSPALKVFALRD